MAREMERWGEIKRDTETIFCGLTPPPPTHKHSKSACLQILIASLLTDTDTGQYLPSIIENNQEPGNLTLFCHFSPAPANLFLLAKVLISNATVWRILLQIADYTEREGEGGGGAGLPCVSSKYLQVPAENLAGWSGLGMSPLIS